MEDKRLYICAKYDEEKSFVLGVFSNRKILFETLKNIDLNDCYIAGVRKKRDVTPESMATGFVGRGLSIYRDLGGEQSLVYKILEINMNEVNPYFRKKFLKNG